jgi:hypothetical protein
MSDTPQKKFVKFNENGYVAENLSCRGLVQRFFLDHTGCSFSISQIMDEMTAKMNVTLNRKTIISAVKELEALEIGLKREKRRFGRRCLPVNFYTLIK